jgi:hypothetical protein
VLSVAVVRWQLALATRLDAWETAAASPDAAGVDLAAGVEACAAAAALSASAAAAAAAAAAGGGGLPLAACGGGGPGAARAFQLHLAVWFCFGLLTAVHVYANWKGVSVGGSFLRLKPESWAAN